MYGLRRMSLEGNKDCEIQLWTPALKLSVLFGALFLQHGLPGNRLFAERSFERKPERSV